MVGEALDSALAKLPSLGQLGLEATTYRTTREATESAALSQLPPETNIRHGVNVMTMEQKHYMSTALTYNPHWARAEDVGGMMAMTGTSGVFINPFGQQGFVDGGEILYRPGITSRYEGQKPAGFKGSTKAVPVFHMREVHAREPDQGIVEDRDFTLEQARHPELDQAKLGMINQIQQTVNAYGSRACWRTPEGHPTSRVSCI